MKIVICEHKNEPVAGFIASAIGDVGVTIFRANTYKGNKLKASYLTYWHMLKLLKKSGCKYCDQGGVDRKNNPGVYKFKMGMGGKEIFSVGLFEACQSKTSQLLGLFSNFVRMS